LLVAVERRRRQRNEILEDHPLEEREPIGSPARDRPDKHGNHCERGGRCEGQPPLPRVEAMPYLHDDHEEQRHQDGHALQEEHAGEKRTEPHPSPRTTRGQIQRDDNEQKEQGQQCVRVVCASGVHVQEPKAGGQD
jgi:hypothetical protein